MNTPTPSPAPLSADEIADLVAKLPDLEYVHPNTVLRLLATAKDEIIAGLKTDVAREEKAHEKSLEERDFAQDCLQQAHIRLGGGGEWVARAGAIVQPPHTGDLRYDVPALAADVLARAETAESRVKVLEEALRKIAAMNKFGDNNAAEVATAALTPSDQAKRKGAEK